MKIQQSKRQFVVTIPLDIMRLLGWMKGTEVAFMIENGKVVMKKLEVKE